MRQWITRYNNGGAVKFWHPYTTFPYLFRLTPGWDTVSNTAISEYWLLLHTPERF